jgi:hypothetical protein
MPSSATELFNDVVRVQADLTNASQVRVFAQIGDNYGPSGSIVFCQYSIDGGNSWRPLTTAATASAKGAQVSTWSSIPTGAKQDVLVRAVSNHGNNTDVDIQAFHLQVK